MSEFVAVRVDLEEYLAVRDAGTRRPVGTRLQVGSVALKRDARAATLLRGTLGDVEVAGRRTRPRARDGDRVDLAAADSRDFLALG